MPHLYLSPWEKPTKIHINSEVNQFEKYSGTNLDIISLIY